MRFLRPTTPAEDWAHEREQIARKAPHLSVVAKDPRPDPEMFTWKDPATLWERKP